MLDLVLYIGAAICFGLATIGIASRVNLVALGLLLVTLVSVFHGFAEL